jgi:hypothetical protein
VRPLIVKNCPSRVPEKGDPENSPIGSKLAPELKAEEPVQSMLFVRRYDDDRLVLID